MPRDLNKLSAKFVETVTKPGRYADGGGLYLQVSMAKQGVTKSWLFRYMRGGGITPKIAALVSSNPMTAAPTFSCTPIIS